MSEEPGFFAPLNRSLGRFARLATEWTGTTGAFVTATLIVMFWGLCGPVFHYSDTWQLVINTGTTIITFLMVFLIQRAQNRDSAAVQLKLNELIAAVKGASNRLIDVEDLSDEEILELRASFRELAKIWKAEHRAGICHTVDEVRPPTDPRQGA